MNKNYFESIIGYKSVKKELERIIDQLAHPEKYAVFGISEPHGLLLHGVPGVGKSTLAQCVLEASQRNIFVCCKDIGSSDFVAEITKTFEDATNAAPSIILLEDMDKFANVDERRKDAAEFVTIQACIDKVKDKQVFVVATVNNMKKLPDSLIRAGRFDIVIEMKCPTGKDAEELILHYLSKKSFVGDLDVKLISRLLQGCSCAELETIINQAATYAAFENKCLVEMEHMIKAILRTRFNASEVIEPDEKALPVIACHEAGHALIAELLEPGSVNLITVLSHDSSTGGLTSVHRDECYYCFKELLDNKVMHLLAGKAATEICYQSLDMGATSDLRTAFDIVGRFVEIYCSNGFDQSPFRGNPSNELLSRRDVQIAQELNNYYEKTKQLIWANKHKLDLLTDCLIKEKTLIGDQVRQIISCA